MNKKRNLPAAIESMIEGLVDPTKNSFLKESHLAMMQQCIEAMQEAIVEYEKGKRYMQYRDRGKSDNFKGFKK